MRTKPTVGQKLYSLNVGNAARNNPIALTEVIVTKVGRLYFTAQPEGKGYLSREYQIKNWREKTQYSASSELYETPQQWEETRERGSLRESLRKLFDHWGDASKLSLDQLRRIKTITDETPV